MSFLYKKLSKSALFPLFNGCNSFFYQQNKLLLQSFTFYIEKN